MWGLLILATTMLATADNDEMNKKGLERLQGDWQVVSASRDGKEIDEAKKITLTFDGKKLVVKRKGKEEKATFELATETVRGTFVGGDIDMVRGPKDEKLLGRYWLDKD